MSIKRHLDWLGLETRIFNAGNYRRELAQGEEQGSAFFDPTNKDGAEIRRRCAEAALHDALSSLADPEGNVCVAIFDATNTTVDRRRWLKEQVAAAAEQLASSNNTSSGSISSRTAVAGSDSDDGVIAAPAAAAAVPAKSCGLKLAFAETVLTSDEQVWQNVKDAKLKSPDCECKALNIMSAAAASRLTSHAID
jgi:6-phosphofructo-2-kinase